MDKCPPDKKADILAPEDRGEPITRMEPLLIGESSRHRGALTDLAVELAAKSSGLRRSLAAGVRAALADLVRSVNCYYSNLIEGHDTHPIDIERALKNDYSDDPRKRDLQLEARAHISVQQWIDAGNLRGRAVVRKVGDDDPGVAGHRCKGAGLEQKGPGIGLHPESETR